MQSRALITALLFFIAGSGIFICNVSSDEIKHSGIITVTNETRYFVQHPDVNPVVFNKEYYAKGNVIFTTGERIDGKCRKFSSTISLHTITKTKKLSAYIIISALLLIIVLQ